MICHPQTEQIRKRADELVRLHGASIPAREQGIIALMDEYRISDRSACQYFAEARKRQKRLRRPHGATV